MVGTLESELNVQELETAEDFDLLAPGDLVYAEHEGKPFSDRVPMPANPMLVSKDSNQIKNGLMLIQRYSPAGIFRIRLNKEQIRVDDEGTLRFDYHRAEGMNVFADYDWVYYDCYMRELMEAGLE